MDFVHNGDVDLHPFSIGKMYISDWEVIEHPAFEIELQWVKLWSQKCISGTPTC